MIIYFSLLLFIRLFYGINICFIISETLDFIWTFKGPFIPLYGVGACLLIYFAPYLKSSIYLTIFVGGFMMTILEYLASLFIEKVFETKMLGLFSSSFSYPRKSLSDLFYNVVLFKLSFYFLYTSILYFTSFY